MKKQSRQQPVLRNQEVRRKKRRRARHNLRAIQGIGSFFLKLFSLGAIIVTISLGFLSLYRYLLESPYLKLQKIHVKGVDAKIGDEIIEMCGLNSDSSLLAINLDGLKRKVENHPWVRSAKLERRLPHRLIIYAEKQTPLALVVMDKIYCMNRFGEIYKELGESEMLDLPIITGLSSKGPDTQRQLQSATQIMRILEAQKGLWSLDQLSEIQLRRNGGVSLYFTHMPAEINLIYDIATIGKAHDFRTQTSGPAAPAINLAAKMDALKEVVKHLKRTGRIRQVMRIDLNYVDGVVVSFKQADNDRG